MGVPQFLSEVLDSAGRRIDLSYYAQGIGKRRVRPLRIGVDVSSWIYRACVGHGDILADERHLSNYGRAALHFRASETGNSNSNSNSKTQQQEKQQEMIREYVTACTVYVIKRLLTLQKESKAEILVVLDGATPPIKLSEVKDRSQKRKEAEMQRDEPVDPTGNEKAQEQREKGFRRAGAGHNFSEVVTNVIEALRLNAIPFLVSPYEADGQLAYLTNQGYIDLIITEDSDLVAYGASPILYKVSDSIGDGVARGIMLRKEDLGATKGSLDLMDFSPVMLAVMFVAVGSDYCKKLKGIGIITASKIVRSAFLEKRQGEASPLETVFRKLYDCTYESNLSDEFKANFESNFLAAVFMYRHPIVFEPLQGRCISVGCPDQGGDPELANYEPYTDLCRNADRRVAIAGTLFESPVATYIAEGWISPRTMRPRDNTEIPSHVQDFIDQGEQVQVLVDDEASEDQNETQDMETQDMETQDMETQDMETQDMETQEAAVMEAGADSETAQDLERGEPNDGQVVSTGKRKASDDVHSEEESTESAKKVSFEPEVVDVNDNDEYSVEDNLETQASLQGYQDEPFHII
jgi:5'-3' exonuclease